MIHLCMKCDRVIKDGDRVTMEVTSVYHQLPSVKTFALDKGILECDSETLRHENCHQIDGD